MSNVKGLQISRTAAINNAIRQVSGSSSSADLGETKSFLILIAESKDKGIPCCFEEYNDMTFIMKDGSKQLIYDVKQGRQGEVFYNENSFGFANCYRFSC